jgi:3-hydroxyisobutyrate dehydrogenase
MEISRGSGSRVPLAEAAEGVYVEAVKRYPELSKKDFSSVYRYLEE